MKDSQYSVLIKRIDEFRRDNKALKQNNEKMGKQLLEYQQKSLELHRENQRLKQLLLAYENAHTPPSLSKKKRPPREKSGGKLGAKKGHAKWERPEPKPTKTVEHKLKTCPKCKRALGKAFKILRKLVEEIPEPQPIEVIEHLIHQYFCRNCGKQVVAPHNLPKGRFGFNIEAHVTLLKFDDRLPLRKVKNALNRHYKLDLTNVGVFNITKRASKKLQPEYAKQIQLLCTSKVVYVDETKIKINCKPYWIWVFVGANQTILVIRKSRSQKVIKEILGEKYLGTIACDGWQSYSEYTSNLQRCRAHILREAKQLAYNHKEFANFYVQLKNMYKKILRIREKPPPLKKRQKHKEKMEQELQYMADQLDSYKDFVKFSTKIKNGLNYWFTCITNLLVEPTNNIAERALREIIVQRKIIGCLRREKGAQIMETITSRITTWKQQGLALFPTLKKHLTTC